MKAWWRRHCMAGSRGGAGGWRRMHHDCRRRDLFDDGARERRNQQRDVKAHAVRSIKTIAINRVAVMPLVEAIRRLAIRWLRAAEAITAELYSQVAMAGGWDPFPQPDVDAALQKMPPTTVGNLDDNALKLAHDVSVDGVLYGTVERYKERVGMDYSAASPASVTFSLKFVDLKSKQIVWTAKFAKSQAALVRKYFRSRQFCATLRTMGARPRDRARRREGSGRRSSRRSQPVQNVKRFETGTYGELKSGQQRYNTGPKGIY